MNDAELLPEELDRTRLTPLRRMTIDALQRSHATTVPVTVMAEARAEALLAARAQFMAAEVPVSMTALLARVLSVTLADHPDVNAALTDTDMIRFTGVNLGIAVALPDGNLTVPAVRSAHALGVPELVRRIANLRDRARMGKLTLADVRGGTFSLSNIGMVMPGGTGTAVIPTGQCGILVVGGTVERPVVQDGAVRPGKVLPLSMTFDHRIVNGVPAWKFLRELISRLENPSGWVRPNQ
ncbi:MAG: 2-oxo acid dehydrogenase subunit E2 [Betaproteobacteria bacterium]|nr:2-oxo acid dehydrogenase subunit E2 [Betaproteobacteria bacterium]